MSETYRLQPICGKKLKHLQFGGQHLSPIRKEIYINCTTLSAKKVQFFIKTLILV